MLKEAISIFENIFLPLIQELIPLVFLSLYIKGDIFTWLPFSEYLLKGDKEKPLLVCTFPWTVCLLHKKYRASYELLLGYVAHVLSLLFSCYLPFCQSHYQFDWFQEGESFNPEVRYFKIKAEL